MTARKPRILFVEDHEDTRELIAFVLKTRYAVVTAATMAEALKLVSSENFSLLIFDAWLADGSGIELCKQIRQLGHRTPILFYSGLALARYKELALSSGAQTYLVKPVDTDELLDAVSSLISPQVKSIPDRDEVTSSPSRLRLAEQSV